MTHSIWSIVTLKRPAHTRGTTVKACALSALAAALAFSVPAAFAATPDFSSISSATATAVTSTNSLAVGASLTTGKRLTSTNGLYRLTMQGDSNLVIYTADGKPIWASNTFGKSGVRVVLQKDSNLVMYTASGKAVWASNTVGKGAVNLLLKDDGNLVLINKTGTAVWATNTGGVPYASIVSFGDSLSDVGTYRVSTIAAVGGGKYNVNGPLGMNWTEKLAEGLKLKTPCAAQTGLNSVIPSIPPAAVTNRAGCYGYAQGGARVTHPIGPGNINTYPQDAGGALGQLTDPVINQINRHLKAAGGRFSGKELVTVLAGGNDAFMNLAVVAGTAAATNNDPAAVGAASQNAVAAMAQAGAELAADVNTLIVGKGAKRVVVLTLPDLSQTPYALTKPASTQGLINAMVTAFNSGLTSNLQASSAVLVVDAYTQGRLQFANPAQYGITSVTTPACDLTKTIFASSLVCSTATLAAGDVSRYAFADGVHPAPYGYALLAGYTAYKMAAKSWLTAPRP
jgi:outer membrane lipase/esterase